MFYRSSLRLVAATLVLACGCGAKRCTRASPAPPAEIVPHFSPPTPPELLVIAAPVHDLRATPEGLVLLTASTWSANPPERVIELRPRDGGPTRRIARTSPLAWFVGAIGGEIVWTERNETEATVAYTLHAAPLAGGPARVVDPQGLELGWDGIAVDRGRILGRGRVPSVGVLLALPLTGGPREIVARAGNPSIRSRAQWIRSGCDDGRAALPAVRAGEELFVGASLKAGDVSDDLRATYDSQLTVVLCKLGSDGTFDVVASRYGDAITLLGADGEKVVAAIDGEVKVFDRGRESSRAPLPAGRHVAGSALAAGEIFVLQQSTIYRLRRDADRFERLLEHALSFVVDGDRVLARMLDGVASVPLSIAHDARP